MRPKWFYNFCISCISGFDWFLDIFLLVELASWDDNDHWVYFFISLIIQIIARVAVCWYPLKYYDYQDANKCKMSLSMVSCFALSSLLQFYHTIFDDTLSDVLLHWAPTKRQKWVQNVHFSTFQVYLNTQIQLHSIHAITHGLLQSLPQMILLQCLLLREDLQYDDNPIIWVKFFISLATLMVLAPIYCNWIYYRQLNGRDHYNLYTFLFVPLAVCCDLLAFHYVISFLVFYERWDVLNTSYDTGDTWHAIMSSLWSLIFYDVLFVLSSLLLIALVCCLIWLIYHVVCTDNIHCDCALLLAGIISVVLWIVIVPILIAILFFCLLFCNMIWLVLLTQLMLKRFPLPYIELWDQSMHWVKRYTDIQDLKIRLFCLNYHILPSINATVQCAIQNQLDQRHDMPLKWKAIRKACKVQNDTHRIPLWLRCILCIFGPIYFVSRVLLTVLPVIGFHYNHSLYEHSVVVISLFYIIWLCATVCLLPMVTWHHFIVYHIAPGAYHLETHGHFYSSLPPKDKLEAIRLSHWNSLRGIGNNILYSYDALHQYFVQKEIVDTIVSFLPGTLFVDYALINSEEDQDLDTEEEYSSYTRSKDQETNVLLSHVITDSLQVINQIDLNDVH
eukprot:166750_1